MHVIQTQACMVCGMCSELGLTDDEFRRYGLWTSGGIHIQNAFPEWSPELRELLLTGSHADCWLEMAGDDEEE